MTDVQVQLDVLKGDWTSCRAQDDKKQELFALIDQLSNRLTTVQSDLCDSKELGQLRQSQLSEAKREVDALKFAQAQHAFALVVIDGDCTPFRDEFVQQGHDGGMRAAALLRQAVEEDLRSSVSDAAHHLQVVVRVYANVRGLAGAYVKAGVLTDPTVLDDFIRGFNMGHALCDFVDAGNGKECADEKVKAVFKQSLNDVHCRQILFGGAADSGYARILGPCAQDDTARRRITLLEGASFAQELAAMRDRFRVTAIQSVMRSQKLPTVKRKESFRITPPTTPMIDYATVARASSSAPAPATALAAPLATHSSAPAPGSSGVLRNRLGQRVDSPLRYDKEDFQSLRAKKLCNSFHILGRCPFEESYGECAHDHKPKLLPRQVEALRAVARQSPCYSGLDCGDRDCLAGHRCAWPVCTGANCKFPIAMHKVDVNIVA